jgi:hypothetical protein
MDSYPLSIFYFIKMDNKELLEEIRKTIHEKHDCILSDDQIDLIADLFMNDYKDVIFNDSEAKWHITHAYICGIKFAIKFISYK